MNRPMNEDLERSLQPGRMINSDNPAVVAFANNTAGSGDARERVVRLYYAVRDGFRYDPYKIDLSSDGLSASRVLTNGYGWCIPKAALLAAACRVIGVPARLGLADVRNHLSSANLREVMGTDIFYRHGYTVIYLEGRWVKATPAFNIDLCRKFGLHTLEFDGIEDSICHSFDLQGNQYMEYVNFHGEFDDVPCEDLLQVFARYYPNLPRLDNASWDDDVDAEVSNVQTNN